MFGKRFWMAACAALALSAVLPCQRATAIVTCADCDGCAICDGLGCSCCDIGVTRPLCRARFYNWNRPYAHAAYGRPVALVVPPTATMQTNWGWGVSSFRLSRIDHQFGRNYPGWGSGGRPFRNTPRWPSDTNQFGVYHVRGPW